MIALIVIGVIPLLVVANYNHPSADDYFYTMDYMRPTVLAGGSFSDVLTAAAETSAKFYQTWQGLYTGAFFLAFQPAVFGEDFYSLTTWILLIASLLSFLLLAYVLSKYVVRSDSKAWVGLGFLSWFAFTQLLPSAVQGLYWYNGAMNYTLFWTFGAFMIASTIAYTGSTGAKSILWLIISSITAFILAGGNHVTTVGGIFILFVLSFFQIKRKAKLGVLIPLVICILGLAAVMLAPGTSIRASALGSPGIGVSSLFHTAFDSAYATFELLGSWFNLSFICFLIAILPCAISLFEHSQKTTHVSLRHVLGYTVFAVITIWVMLCPSFYAQGTSGAGRLHNVLYMSFLALSAAGLVLVVFFVGDRKKQNSDNQRHSLELKKLSFSTQYGLALSCVALFVLMFSFGSGFNFQYPTWAEASKELSTGLAAQYDLEMDQRVALYESQDLDDVEVEPLTVRPGLLYFDEITTDPDDWRNKSMAEYYEKQSIKVKEQ